MVSALLDAISSFVKRVDFDFFINLSDAELSLRTNDELSGFLHRFKGRTFMRVNAPPPSLSELIEARVLACLHAEKLLRKASEDGLRWAPMGSEHHACRGRKADISPRAGGA